MLSAARSHVTRRRDERAHPCDDRCHGADRGEIRIGRRATETKIKRLSRSGDLARYVSSTLRLMDFSPANSGHARAWSHFDAADFEAVGFGTK
jgi:hypothetical protein